MERNAKIGIAGVVLVGLCVGLYYQQKKDAALGTVSSKPDLPELKVGDDVDKIDITNKHGEIVLEKHGDNWDLTKPVAATANQPNVKSLIDGLKDLKLVDRAVTNADDAAKKTYELASDTAIHVLAFKGGDKKLDATFGKSGGLGDAVMIAGNPDIFLAKGYQSWAFGREVKDWRDKEIFKFDDKDVTSYSITNAHGVFAFTKGDKDGGPSDWTGTLNKKNFPNLDGDKVKNALGAFKTLTADDFGDGKSPSDTGLDAPEATVFVQTKDGKTFTLRVGKISEKSSHYAQKEGDATIYTIGSFPSEWAFAEVSKFQPTADGGAPDSGAKAPKAPKASSGDAGKK